MRLLPHISRQSNGGFKLPRRPTYICKKYNLFYFYFKTPPRVPTILYYLILKFLDIMILKKIVLLNNLIYNIEFFIWCDQL